MNATVRGTALGLIGAAGGAYAGMWLTRWIAGQGFYAILLPGALTGMLCGWLSRLRSHALAVTCAFVGLAAGIVTEWRMAPFIKDESFGFFLRNLHQLRPVTIVLILGGTALAYWFGLGRPRERRVVEPMEPPAE